MNTAEMRISKLGYIDALRGIAVLGVILIHSAQQTAGLTGAATLAAEFGGMGVQLFFVVSAYTLCLSHERRGSEGVRPFYIRRILRIAPLYYFAIILYFLFDKYIKIDSLGPYSLKNVAANVSFTHGFLASASNSIVPGGWSVGTEMAFYIIFPILFPLISKSVSKGTWRVAAWVIAALAFNIAVQFCFYAFVRCRGDMMPHYPVIILGCRTHMIGAGNFLDGNLINQMPVFLVGFAAYFLHRSRAPITLAGPAWQVLGLIGFAAVALILWRWDAPLVWALIPTLCALAFFFLINLIRLLPPSELLIKIGRVSFSLYICHFLVAWGALPRLEPFLGALPPMLAMLAAWIFVTAATYPIALMTERWIEEPGIAAGAALIRRFDLAPPARLRG